MKYIRTKDDRIVAISNTSKLVLYDDEKLVIDTTKKGQTCVYGIVKKKADTIEELCDEFVALLFDDETIYECPLGYYVEIFKAKTHCIQALIKSYDINMIGVRAIYGAIWTEWGLKYVAKMNEKGELELV